MTTVMMRAMELGQKVRRLKAERGLSYQRLADAAGCSSETIRRIIDLGNVPRADLGYRLADALGVSMDWLFSPEADWPPESLEQDYKAAEAVHAALAGAGLAGELSDRERELVAILRSLDAGQQSALMARIRGYRDGLQDAPSAEAVEAELDRLRARLREIQAQAGEERRDARGA